GVARVVVAMTDPHTRNRGAGLGILRAAGIEVLCPLLESSALALNPGHARRYETGLPYVRVKLAMSLDGKTALATGESKWITGAEARRDVQRLRARSGAIVTGVQTIVDDDPALNVRADELDVEHNEISASLLRPVVVLDSALRIPAGARVLENPATIVACLEQTGNPGFEEERILRLPAGADGRVDPGALLRELAGRDVNEVLFECGATLAASVIRGGYVDEIVIYAAPVMLGADARSLLNIAKIDTMRDRIEFQINEVRRVGKDMRITCIPQRH
ncbi:MAG: bifunctional diaminohydroxyphosphoribosylaminopyrimidine deaminase/5-amino-6-(5-phosphoribosylamino)uracil reductase RibD, partial [Pseudomonadales bacterium]|nr:bifunctional diaminohydroxyphosphoribosylaminopyrimidine deaminase/5-amino-6-(5-phosphoribosylamino)uracil reductase RibD [Pseudomonadales bacterium]